MTYDGIIHAVYPSGRRVCDTFFFDPPLKRGVAVTCLECLAAPPV